MSGASWSTCFHLTWVLAWGLRLFSQVLLMPVSRSACSLEADTVRSEGRVHRVGAMQAALAVVVARGKLVYLLPSPLWPGLWAVSAAQISGHRCLSQPAPGKRTSCV